MKNIEICLVLVEKSLICDTKTLRAAIQNKLDNPMTYKRIEIAMPLKKAQSVIEKTFGNGIEIRQGVTGGCYGARDGNDCEGLTLWVDANLVTDRCTDENTEYVNVHHLLKDNATLTEIDADSLDLIAEQSDLDAKRDNSYNWRGSGQDCEFIFDFDFTVYQPKEYGKGLIAIKYHCGGDIRGNYTSVQVWSFDSSDELYSILYPSKMILDQENA
jgi:hypothetical protein